MTHAYRVPVLGGRPDATEGLRARVARGRPNWWVILAVSLGLMALLVATAGGTPRATRRGGGSAQAAAHVGLAPGADRRAGRTKGASRSTTATTTTTTTTDDNHHANDRARTFFVGVGRWRHRSPFVRDTARPEHPTARGGERHHDDPGTACRDDDHGTERGAGRPHAGLSRPPVGDVEQVRVHRDGRHGDLGRVVGRHVPHHGGQLPEREPERGRDLGHGRIASRRHRKLSGHRVRACVGDDIADLHDLHRTVRWLATSGIRRTRRLLDVAGAAIAALLAFTAVPAVLLFVVGNPLAGGLGHAWRPLPRDLLCLLVLAAWVAWAACCAQLIRAVTAHVRSGEVGVLRGAPIMDRLAARIAFGVLALTTVGAPLSLSAGCRGQHPGRYRTALRDHRHAPGRRAEVPGGGSRCDLRGPARRRPLGDRGRSPG